MKRSASRIGILPLLAFVFAFCSSSPQAQMAKHVQRGDEYMKVEKYREAIIEYRNAVKVSPQDAGVRWKLAKAAVAAKDLRTAYPELQKVVAMDPTNHEALGTLGKIYLLTGKNEEAAAVADKLVMSRPEDPAGYILRAGALLRSGRMDDAIGTLKKALELTPNQADTMIKIGNLYVMKRDHGKAKEWYDRALAAEPDSVDVHVTRGNFFFATGDPGEGEREYRRAIELAKEKEILRIALAERFLYIARTEDSEKELGSVIKEFNSQKARKVLAEVRLELGKVNDAKPVIEDILKENPKDLDGKYLKGRVALSEKRLNDAKALFSEVLKQDAAYANARLFNGLVEIQQGQLDLGRKEVEEAVRLDPSNARGHLILGEVSLRAGIPARAESEATEVLQRDPSNAQASLMLADSYMMRKDWKKAEQIYRSIMEQSPASPVGYMKMGQSRKLQGKPGEAAAFFSQAVEKDPGDIAAINEYIFSLGAAKNFEKSRKVLEETLAKEPKNPLVWEMAGRFQFASGRMSEAEKSFLRAIELDPDFPAPYYGLGLLYSREKKFPEAEARLWKVVKKDDRDVGAHALLGVVLNAQGKIDAANKQYRTVVELSPKNVIAANNLASNLADGGGNLDEALKFAQNARESAPEDPVVADTLGWVYYRKGLLDNALPLLIDAAGKRKDNPVIRYHYGVLLAGKGRDREAAAELKTALSLDPNFPGADKAKKTLESLNPS